MVFDGKRIAILLAGGAVAASLAGGPARADDDIVFGQPAPRQYLLNKMFSPKSLGLADGASGAQTSGGQAAAGPNGQPPAEEDDDSNGAYPKRYLLNRMFDMGK